MVASPSAGGPRGRWRGSSHQGSFHLRAPHPLSLAQNAKRLCCSEKKRAGREKSQRDGKKGAEGNGDKMPITPGWGAEARPRPGRGQAGARHPNPGWPSVTERKRAQRGPHAPPGPAQLGVDGNRMRQPSAAQRSPAQLRPRSGPHDGERGIPAPPRPRPQLWDSRGSEAKRPPFEPCVRHACTADAQCICVLRDLAPSLRCLSEKQ